MFVRRSTYNSMSAEARACSAIAIATAEQLTEIAGELDAAKAIAADLREEIVSLRESACGADRTAAMYKKLYEGATKTLGKIAALETPSCAHVGKRMAQMARTELPVLHHTANGTAAAVPTH